jgi:hypothetical protein
MLSNFRTFSRIEESRLLNNIKIHKQGLVLFDNYEQRKHAYDRLEAMHSEKKSELDATLRSISDIIQKYNIIIEEYNHLSDERNLIETELNDLNNHKIHFKKELEDLIRENVLKQKQNKKTPVNSISASSSLTNTVDKPGKKTKTTKG